MTTSEVFRLGYEGEQFAEHTIKADDLIEIIDGAKKLVEIISSSLYDEKATKVCLYVNDIEAGSFWLKLKIELTGAQVNKILKDNPMITPGLLFTGVLALLLHGAWTPEHLKQYESMGKTGFKLVEKLAAQNRVKEATSGLIKAYEGSVTENAKLHIETKMVKEEVSSAQLESAIIRLSGVDEKESQTLIPRQLISIKKPDLLGGDKWDVIFKDKDGKDQKVAAVIQDQEFLQFVKDSAPRYDKFDVIVADLMQETIERKTKRDVTRWFIKKVYSVTNVKNGISSYPVAEAESLSI